MEKKTMVLLGCFGTKVEAYGWLRDRITSKGINPLASSRSLLLFKQLFYFYETNCSH